MTEQEIQEELAEFIGVLEQCSSGYDGCNLTLLIRLRAALEEYSHRYEDMESCEAMEGVE